MFALAKFTDMKCKQKYLTKDENEFKIKKEKRSNQLTSRIYWTLL